MLIGSPMPAPSRDSDNVTFMSYNPTGADTIKCQWIRDIASEHEVDYCSIQEHFKTVKSTNQWFKKQFRVFITFLKLSNPMKCYILK